MNYLCHMLGGMHAVMLLAHRTFSSQFARCLLHMAVWSKHACQGLFPSGFILLTRRRRGAWHDRSRRGTVSSDNETSRCLTLTWNKRNPLITSRVRDYNIKRHNQKRVTGLLYRWTRFLQSYYINLKIEQSIFRNQRTSFWPIVGRSMCWEFTPSTTFLMFKCIHIGKYAPF